MQSAGQSNDIIQSADIEALSKQRSQRPIFSLYLDLRQGENGARNLLERFDQLLQQAAQRDRIDQAGADLRDAWNQEAHHLRQQLTQIQSWQEQGAPPQGLAVFSSQAEGLWRVFSLPVPVFDRLVAQGEPYIRPLEILLNEFKCTLVALLDPGRGRLLRVFLGSVQEIEQMQAVPVTGDALEIGPRLYVRAVADKVESVWREQSCDQLIIGGDDETLLDALREELPETLRQRLVGELLLSPQADLTDIVAEVQAQAAEQERQLEAQRVEELISRAEENKGAVLGVEQSLLAVRDKRVQLLVVEEQLHLAGGECINCGFLAVDNEQAVCPLCGMALRPEQDVIEVALKRVLDQGGEIEVLRSPNSRDALELYGRIGALLKATGANVVKDMATQRTIAKDGEINQDVLHDEAIEESFPASDPPSWTH